MVPEPDLRFEDLDAGERRVEADGGVAADEVRDEDVPEQPLPSATYYDDGREIPRCADGQEVPGMEVDCVVAVSSPCAVCRVENSPSAVRRVERGGAVKPSLCDDTFSDVNDSSLQELLCLQTQQVADELSAIDAEILSVVRSLGGNAGRYRCE